MLRLLSIQILAAVLLTVGARADDAATYKKWHDACVSGDSASIDKQIKKYEGRIAKNKKDYLAQAYLGSACALRAKESFWGTTKLKYLKRGKKILDGAVAGSPKDPLVRTIRAISYYKVPKRFKTRPTCIKDFQILVPIGIDRELSFPDPFCIVFINVLDDKLMLDVEFFQSCQD